METFWHSSPYFDYSLEEVLCFSDFKDVRLFGGLFLYWYLSYIGKLTKCSYVSIMYYFIDRL